MDAESACPVWPSEARVITAIVIEPIAPPVQAWIPALGATRSTADSAARKKPAGTNA